MMALRRLVARLGAAAGLAACLLLAGCASATKIYVQSSEATNGGKVLHMMVRAVDAKTAVASASYQEMAFMLFAADRDPSIIHTEPVFPGRLTSVTLDRPADKSMVLYFFFTDQHGLNWHVQLNDPLPNDVYIDLGQTQIERVQVRR